MKTNRLLALLLVISVCLSCSRDPQVRKQKYFESGGRYFEQGKYPEAAIQFANAIQVDEKFGSAHYQLAKCRLKLEEWNAAYSELARALELQPDNYDAHLDMANLLISVRDFKQAKTHVDLLLEMRPNNPSVYLSAANLLAQQGDISEALQLTQKAIAMAPQKWESYVVMAVLQQKTNQPDVAEGDFNKALQLNPKASNARLGLAEFFRARRRLPEAEQQIRTAIDNDSQNPEPRAALVRLYVSEDKRDLAEQVLKKVKTDLPLDSSGYRMLGDYYFSIGDLERAGTEYRSLYREHPKDPRVKLNYDQLLILEGRLAEANKLTEEILKDYPGDDDALICRGQIQNRQGHPGDAVDTLQRVLTDDPGNAIAHYHLGVAYNALGKAPLAESEWQSAARISPDLVEAHRALAQIAVRKADPAALFQNASDIIRLQPQSPDGYTLRSAFYIYRQRYADAEADARRAIDLAPRLSIGYLQIGNVSFEQRKFVDAQQAYQQALDRDPNSSDGLGGVMNALIAQEQIDQAITVARAQIQKEPDNSAFEDLLGTLLFDLRHDMPAAEAAFKKSIDLDKKNSDAIVKLGRLQVAKGSVDNAIETYQKSLGDNPKQPDLYVLTGELYEKKQDWQSAKQMYQKALELSPKNPVASNNLAYTLLQAGDNIDIALSLAQTARQGMPNSPNVADTLGYIYYQKGAFKSAIDQFQEALRLIDKNKTLPDANIYYHLALAYQKTNQPSLARHELQRAFKINPNYNDAAKLKKQLAQVRS